MHLNMDLHFPITPLRPGAETFQRRKDAPLFPAGIFTPMDSDFRRLSKAISEATVMWDQAGDPDDDDATDIDDDGENNDFEENSAFEEDFADYQFSISNEGRRSQATISTFDEVATPHSARRSGFDMIMDSTRPIEGPVGPHLFRTSTHSSDFNFDFALQLSPVVSKSNEGFSGPRTGSTMKTPSNALMVSAQEMDSHDDGPSSWSAERVAYWMAQRGVDAETCDLFESHDITGTVLMDMNFDDLKEVEVRSFGKRHMLWHHICELRGGSGRVSPAPTPFQDTGSNCSRSRTKKSECEEEDTTSVPPGVKKRKGRKIRGGLDEPITPAESVSIVAIEQLLPKEHKCSKGVNCSKWKKQQRLLKCIQEENGFPISPESGGRIFFTGDPGNATTAPNILGNMSRSANTTAGKVQTMSVDIPSVVASSDLLGPGLEPAYPQALQEQFLQHIQERDPQENVKHFLTLQHIEPPQAVLTVPIESSGLDMFPSRPTITPPPNRGPSPLTGLKCLPRLHIPGAQSAVHATPLNTFLPLPMTVSSPLHNSEPYRFGTPASEMDVPVPTFSLGPETRDMSRSVPPNMQYRDPIARTASAATFQRRGPSFHLPTLGENEIYSLSGETARSSTLEDGEYPYGSGSRSDSGANKLSGETERSESDAMVTTLKSKSGRSSPTASFKGVNHVGWMKKRRTRLLRHEWADHHFRLTGTQLAMHANSLPSSSPLDTLNIDEYAVGCSSLASSKLTAKFKALSFGREKGLDPAAFSFQLVPAGKDGEEKAKIIRALAGVKTHHFAVRSRDERIDWMRELMLAKALKAKAGEGYKIRHMTDGSSP